MAQDAFLTDPNNPEYADIFRQRKLAEMLTLKAFEQPQGNLVSGRYVAPSWTQQLAPLVSGIAGQAMGKNLDEKQLKLAEALRIKGGEEVKDIMSTYKTNPELALEKATTAQTPQGKALAPLVGKVAINEGPTSKQEFDLAKTNGFPGNYSQFLEWSANLKTPKTSIYNNMPPAESEYAKTFGSGVAKQDLALKDIAESAPSVISNVQRQRDILKTGKVITGFGADQRLALAQFGQAIGATGKGEDLVANTQTLLAGRAGSTLDAIKTSNLGSAQGFSNTDREFLEKAKLGGIKYTAESLNRQLDLEEKVARAGLDKWNARLKELPKSASNPINTNPIAIPVQSNVVDYNSLK